MTAPLDPRRLHEAALELDERQQKIAVAMIAAMIEHSDRVRDAEWIGEQLARTISLALDVANDAALDSAAEGVDIVQRYANEHSRVLLSTAFGIFGQVAITLQQRGGPITGEAAMAEVMRYFDPNGFTSTPPPAS